MPLIVFTLICHNCFSDLLTVYTPFRQLRSSADTRTLRIPHVETNTFGLRSFSYSAPNYGILSLLTFVTFSPPMPSKLH